MGLPLLTMKILRGLMLCGGTSLLALTCAESHAESIAVVNQVPIPKARYDYILSKQAGKIEGDRAEVEKLLRDELVMLEICAQEAEKTGLGGTEAFKAKLEIMRQQTLMEELFAIYLKKNPVTSNEVRDEYNRLKQAQDQKEYRARHILVARLDEAKEILQKLKEGYSFAELARSASIDTGSAMQGGDLDWSPASNYVDEFQNALVALKVGQTTREPVKSKFGYHIIQLDEVRDRSFPPLDEVIDKVQTMLEKRKIQNYRNELKSKAKTNYQFSK